MRFHGGRDECYCQSPPYYQEVDDLLRHAVAQLDAGRPVGPLIKNAQFWRAAGPRNGYDVDAVDWFLYQIRLLPDHSELTGIGTDPWHDLEVTQLTRSEVSGPAEHPTGRAWLAPEKQFAEKCADAWRDFGQAPGTHLRWGRAALRIYELRTPEAQTIASLARRLPIPGRRHWREIPGQHWREELHSYKDSPGTLITAGRCRDRRPQRTGLRWALREEPAQLESSEGSQAFGPGASR